MADANIERQLLNLIDRSNDGVVANEHVEERLLDTLLELLLFVVLHVLARFVHERVVCKEHRFSHSAQ